MPATATRPATARQLGYINALRQERGMDALTYNDRNVMTAATASDMITRLLDAPRSSAQRRAQGVDTQGERIATPSFETRAGRMLQAGGIEASVTLQTGSHVTIRVSTRRQVGRGWANCGPRDEGARTNISVLGRRVGWVNVDASGNWTLTLRTRQASIRAAVIALFDYAAGNSTDERVQESSRCGRCFRTLTDPVSIDRGIGPECYGHTTGSHHVAVEQARTLTSSEVRERNARIDAAFAETAEDRMHRQAAEREQQQERAAYENEMREERALGIGAPSITEAAAPLAQAPSQLASEVARARDIIAEALDAYGENEAAFALQVFDRLAR